MYKNAYYQREKNLVHIWDDKQGYRTFPYTRYAYEKAANGNFTTLYGDKVSKIYKFKKDDPDLFESDVPETTRVLVDTYTDSDLPSEGHVILTYDIECEMESGLPNPEEATNELTSIALMIQLPINIGCWLWIKMVRCWRRKPNQLLYFLSELKRIC